MKNALVWDRPWKLRHRHRIEFQRVVCIERYLKVKLRPFVSTSNVRNECALQLNLVSAYYVRAMCRYLEPVWIRFFLGPGETSESSTVETDRWHPRYPQLRSISWQYVTLPDS